MNIQIINGCAGTDPRLLTAGTDPGQWKLESNIYFTPGAQVFTIITDTYRNIPIIYCKLALVDGKQPFTMLKTSEIKN